MCVSFFLFFFLLSDQVFPPTCNIGKNFLSLNYLAEYLQPKAAEGCVMSSQPQDKEVHIIELITPNSNPYRWVSVSMCVFSELRDENKDMMWLDMILTWGRERLSPPSCEREGVTHTLGDIHRIFEESSKGTSVIFSDLSLDSIYPRWVLKHNLNFLVQSSIGIGRRLSSDPPWIPKSIDAQIFYKNGIVFAYNLHTFSCIL